MLYDNISLSVGYVIIDGGKAASITNIAGTETFSSTPTIQYFGTAITWHFGF
jgi:hypothetical protein